MQSNRSGRMVESRGVGRVEMSVCVEGDDVMYRSVRAELFNIPFPRKISPSIAGQVSATAAGWRVRVEIEVPIVGHLCTYTVEVDSWT